MLRAVIGALLVLVGGLGCNARRTGDRSSAHESVAVQSPPFWHELHLFDTPDALLTDGGSSAVRGPDNTVALIVRTDGSQSALWSGSISPVAPFNEAVLSWNAAVSPGCGFCVELRVGRNADDLWSPWLYVGDWGDTRWIGERTTQFPLGRIDVDYFRSAERFDRAQFRIRAAAAPGASGEVRVARVAICVSDTTSLSALPQRASTRSLPANSLLATRNSQSPLSVPFRSQKSERPEIAGRICSPTSVAMVMAYRGIDRPTAEVAAACFDAAHNLYGNWPRNVQAAYSFGAPGYLTRFSDWRTVEQCLAADQPLIASIRVEREGDLPGAPYKTTDGHLLVIRGFDANGDVLVNDPAAPTPERGQTTYPRAALERCWFRGSGGLAYVLQAPPR